MKKKEKKKHKRRKERIRDFFAIKRTECSHCKGTGYHKGLIDAPDRTSCWNCGGKGYL